MQDLPTLRSWLSEAEIALHKLLTGAAVASISNGAEGAITYTRANVAELRAYINRLHEQIAELEGAPRNRLRPIYASF